MISERCFEELRMIRLGIQSDESVFSAKGIKTSLSTAQISETSHPLPNLHIFRLNKASHIQTKISPCTLPFTVNDPPKTPYTIKQPTKHPQHQNKTPLMMQLHVAFTFALATLPSLISGWTLQLGKDVWDGKGNKKCTGGFTHGKGEKMSWDRAIFSGCCIHMHADEKCGHEVGYSCKDWDKKLGQTVKSFVVTNC